MNSFLVKGISAFILLTLLTSSTTDKPKILIIGDSISIGYFPYMKEKLADKAVVGHNPGNAQHSGTGLQKIEEWLGDEKWDIIQCNWGLWDLCYRHPDSKVPGKKDKVNGNVTFSLAEYEANLDAIITKLKTLSDAKLIFVTTSYVPNSEPGRFQEDAILYNEIAQKVMKKHSIQVNDIYDDSMHIHSKYGKGSNDVHYNAEGYEQLGELISQFLAIEIASLPKVDKR